MLTSSPDLDRVRLRTRKAGMLEVARAGAGYELALPAWAPDPKPLPARPSLEQYKKQAKELLKAYRSADVETIRRVKRNHPRFEKLAEHSHALPLGLDISKFALADAQLVIAREHGFESWPKFAKRIEVINSEAAALANPVCNVSIIVART